MSSAAEHLGARTTGSTAVKSRSRGTKITWAIVTIVALVVNSLAYVEHCLTTNCSEVARGSA